MREREFNNRMSLRGAYLYATCQSQQNKIVGRDPHVGFSILLRMTNLIQSLLRVYARGQNCHCEEHIYMRRGNLSKIN